MFTSFDLLLVIAALLVMAVGFARRRALWAGGQAEKRQGSLRHLLVYLLSHQAVLKRRFAGAAHLFLFWGFVVFVLVVVAAQFDFRLSPFLSHGISLILDILGLLLFVGTVFFLIRGGKTRGTALDGIVPRRIFLPALLVIGIVLTGFLSEGVRLRILSSGFAWEAPVGYAVSRLLPGSPLMMQVMIRVHLLLVLVLAALVPYTFMRHIAAASLNVYYEDGGRKTLSGIRHRDAHLPFIGQIDDFSWKQLLEAEACVSCGRCTARCPASLSGKALSPRNVIQSLLTAAESAQRGGSGDIHTVVADDALWACTACMACFETCPVCVDPADKVIEFRRQRVMGQGALPVEARPMLRDLRLFGDTYGRGSALRTDWALNCDAAVLGKDKPAAEFLIWTGCAGAYHPRYREVARALVGILTSAEVDFAILGQQEQCCGDPARRLGDEGLFRHLAGRNIQRLDTLSFGKIVTLCPHCFHTLKNEYPHLGGSYEVAHAAEVLAGLINQGRIHVKYPAAGLLAIHDPCYLGRVNRIFEPLREIARSIPGITLKELENSRENGFCCGGGGGQMWLHETEGQRINHMRAQEALGMKPDIVATACPYCLAMLEDGMNSLEAERPPLVKDLVEILAACMQRQTIAGS